MAKKWKGVANFKDWVSLILSQYYLQQRCLFSAFWIRCALNCYTVRNSSISLLSKTLLHHHQTLLAVLLATPLMNWRKIIAMLMFYQLPVKKLRKLSQSKMPMMVKDPRFAMGFDGVHFCRDYCSLLIFNFKWFYLISLTIISEENTNLIFFFEWKTLIWFWSIWFLFI